MLFEQNIASNVARNVTYKKSKNIMSDAVIAGVVSRGNGCAHADFPGVYARVTTVLNWIQSNMVCNNINSWSFLGR